jgi:hypothetical protein
VGERDRMLHGSVPALLICDYIWIGLRTHPERVLGQACHQVWRLPGQLLCGRLLPDADDYDGEHDQDEPHDTDGEAERMGISVQLPC